MIRFTISDYTQLVSGAPTVTQIDEPIGLDSVGLHLRRDDTYHGFLDAIDDSLGSLKFYGDGYSILTAAYENAGVDAYVLLLIEYACDDHDAFSTLYQGRFSFDDFKITRGIEGCYAECKIENGYDLATFRNRLGHKVSLDSRTTFDVLDPLNDPYPELPAYPGIGQPITLNPMLVRQIDYGLIATTGLGSTMYTLPSDTYGNPITGGNPAFAQPSGFSDSGQDNPQNNEFNFYDSPNHVITPYMNINAQEFGDFPGGVGDQYNDTYMYGISDANPIFTYTPDIPYENNVIKIDMELSVAIFNGDSSSPTGLNPNVMCYLMKGVTWNDALTHRNLLANGGYKSPTSSSQYGNDLLDLRANAGQQGGLDTFDNTGTPLHTVYNKLVGCSLYIDEQYNVGPIANEFSTLPFSVGSTVVQFSFHSSVAFNPGDQLFLFIQVDNNLSGNPQTVVFSGDYTYRNTYPNGSGGYTTVTVPVTSSQPLSYIKLTFDSTYHPTQCTAYMVNEALSRSAEIISNGNLRVYSDYFGRTDALPYVSSTDGPGALECITNGLLIRGYSPLVAFYMGVGQFNLLPVIGTSYTLGSFASLGFSSDTPDYIISFENDANNTLIVPADTTYDYPANGSAQFIAQQASVSGVVTVEGAAGVTIISPSGKYTTNGAGSQLLLTKIAADTWLLASQASMFMSFKDLIDALHCIHAVGFGLEPDPNRSGYDLVRVEPITYFYQNTTVLTCQNVDMIETDIDAGNAVSMFRTGYSKWEAEEAQGLDEFLSAREFRTTLSLLRARWDKVCKFVASGYAIEVSRRKLGTTTTDWRYDRDNFIICLARTVSTGSGATATATLSGSSVSTLTLTNGGSGYTDPPAVQIAGGAIATSTLATSGGIVVALALTSPGSGYTAPTVTIAATTPYTGSGATASLTFSDGVITGITLTGAGSGFDAPPLVTISDTGSGTGSGATASAIVGYPVASLTLVDGGSGYTIAPELSIAAVGYKVEQGSSTDPGDMNDPSGAIDNASGMISPTTVYNYRISPIRNALRWLRHVLRSYVNSWSTGQLIFTSGDGNYYATGMNHNDPIESSPLSENQTLTLANYTDTTVTPIYKNELVKFKYPMGYADWQNIYANPYGQIAYSVNDGALEYGYLQELKYDLYGGIGEFTLKPAV